MHTEPSYLRRIYALLIFMAAMTVLQSWQIHGLKSAVQAMDKEMPSVTITVTATRSSNSEVVTVPITVTQGEIDPEETRAQWIARAQATAADWKSAIQGS